MKFCKTDSCPVKNTEICCESCDDKEKCKDVCDALEEHCKYQYGDGNE
jgi:hypothetical protein